MLVIPFLGTAICVAFYYAVCRIVDRIVERSRDPKEPPFLPQKIPFIGHVIGMLRKKGQYYVQLRQQHKAPIYSLAMPEGSKLYVITSIELIGAVQRQPKALAFPPVGVKFAMSLAGSSKEANQIATTNINGEEGDWGLSMDFNKVVYPALTPGPHLEAMNRIVLGSIALSLAKLQAKSGKSTIIELSNWIRHELTIAITDSVYGPRNPFKDRAIEDAFWDFENDLFRIMMNILPSLTARKGYYGRQLISNAFVEYFQKGGLNDGSVFAQTRYASAANHKIPLRDIARFEAVNLIGILTSTVRTVTWILYHIYSDPAVLSDCREEISKIMTEVRTAEGTVSRSLDITRLKSNCPILGSTFQEVLRCHAVGTSVRQVMQDTLLEDTYLLKKGSMIIMPGVVVHTDPSIWGSDVGSFNHKRFLKSGPSTSAGKSNSSLKAPSPSAFRAFGGGTTLCPGRHLATTVTMAVAVMFLMRYEMAPVDGRWPRMTAYNTHAVAAVEKLDYEIEVEIKAKKGFENGKWAFQLNGSDTGLATAAEDLI